MFEYSCRLHQFVVQENWQTSSCQRFLVQQTQVIVNFPKPVHIVQALTMMLIIALLPVKWVISAPTLACL